ncbi:RNA polymerase sigma factor SigY [Paenibacillus sp. J2TS4]|uniref:RNA polymerase sigma factor SigY n=1 Tax=Paenibacillus sp. J2TS4 TaxID=2807194 RepID=UPI001B1BCE34|nr:RNA polymerase sigma factor SigY [Paenibacillus sp. J2TS4]GIP35445.1 RNA polymerase sigma factor SigY [Paenibacillus sp. J2TS4]
MSNEQEWIRQAQAGDSQALAKLLQTHYSTVVHYLIKVTLQPHVAEDIAQDTMLKAIEKIKLYNGQSKFSSWLLTIATRLYIDNFRRKKREKLWLKQETAMRKINWHLSQQGEDWPEVLDTLNKLSYDFRIPIILKHYYGYAYDEIAEMMDIPAGTAKSRVFNGLKMLRKELRPDEG